MLRMNITNWIPCALVILAIVVAATTTHAGVIAADSPTDPAYSAGWTEGSNGGFGFGAWELHASDADRFAINTASTSPIGSTTFAATSGTQLHAIMRRSLNQDMAVGDTFSIDIDPEADFLQGGNRWIGVFLYGRNMHESNQQRVTFGASLDSGTTNWALVHIVENGVYDLIVDTGIPMDGTPIHLEMTIGQSDALDVGVATWNEGTSAWNPLQHFAGSLSRPEHGPIGHFRLYNMKEYGLVEYNDLSITREVVPEPGSGIMIFSLLIGVLLSRRNGQFR